MQGGVVEVVLILLMWLTLSAVIVGMMWAFPAMHIRRAPLHQRPWLCRLLAGELAVRGSVRAGLGFSGVLWWVGAAGMLNSDAVRGGAVLVCGVIVLVALFNAGRRAALSIWGYLYLCGFLGACVIGLFLLAWELSAYLLGCHVLPQ